MYVKLFNKFNLICTVISLFLFSTCAFAQNSGSRSYASDDGGKNEVSAQISGIFTHDSVGNSITQHSTNSGGFLLGYRGYFKDWLGVDAAYGYARNTQQNITTTGTFNVQSNINQWTGALVASLPLGHFHPFALAGGGGLTFSPTTSAKTAVPGVTRQTVGAFLYGGGADYFLGKHLGVRGEYRGFVYDRPNFGLPVLNSNAKTHSAQTSAGIVLRF